MLLKLFNSLFLFKAIQNTKYKFEMKSTLHKDSFIGSWAIYEHDKRDVIHLQPHGAVYKTININPTSYSEYVGGWEKIEQNDDFYFNIKDKNYYGKVINNTLKIKGTVCEGKKSPCYITNFIN